MTGYGVQIEKQGRGETESKQWRSSMTKEESRDEQRKPGNLYTERNMRHSSSKLLTGDEEQLKLREERK